MSRHHQGRRRQPPLSSGVGGDGDGDGDSDVVVVSSPAVASTAAAALTVLHVRYTHPLAVYLNFFPGGIQYPRCPLDCTAEAAEEAEAAAA